MEERQPRPERPRTKYDSWFDNYLGALALVRVYEGKITKGQKIQIRNTQKRASGLGAYVSTPYLSNKE